MKKLLILIGMTLGGWVGWWLGDRFGVMTAFIVSTLGSLIGVVLAWKVGRRFS
jgi:predicted MFS family arabinose efflux permease